MMQNWKYYGKCNVISSECISKYELLNIIKEVYDKDIVIKQNDSVSVNKCLIGEIRKIPIKEQLIRLKEFYNNVN